MSDLWSRRLTVVALFCIAIYVGLDAWSRLDEPSESGNTAQLLEQIRVTRAKEAAAKLVADSLRSVANRSGEKTDANPDGAFTIEPVELIDHTIPAPSVTPSGEPDTTEMAYVTRQTDMRRFLVPSFLVRAYRDERALRTYQDSTVIPLKNKEISQTWDLAEKYKHDAMFWKGVAIATGVLGGVILVLK